MVQPTKTQSVPAVLGRSLGVAAIDPVPIFRDGLANLVHRAHGMHWLGQASSQHGAMQLAEQLRPDVVLLDCALDPHCHLTRLLNAGDPALVIVLLVRDTSRNPQYLAQAIGAGAHALVPRSIDPKRLNEAIRRAHVDRRYLDPTFATLLGRVKHITPEGLVPLPRMPLSRREYQVLQLIAEGLENSGIAKLLFLSVETVRTHVKSILRKLSARDRTHAVTIAFRSGILVTVPDDAHNVTPLNRPVTAPAPR